MVELHLLRQFVAVAEARSFTRAAEELNSTQSVVSRSIKRLEEILGTPLIERTTRSVTLTAAGAAYLDEARLIVERVGLAALKARRIGQGDHAQLRVAVCPSVNAVLIAEGFQRFRTQWPEVQIELKPMFGLHQPDALRKAEIDLAILRRDGLDAHGGDFDSATVSQERLMVVIPALWKLGKSKVRLEELRDVPWIFPDPDLAPQVFQRQLQLCRVAGFEPNIVATIRDSAESDLLIATGHGAMFAFRADASPDPARGYEFLALDDPIAARSEIIVSWARAASSNLIARFAACVANPALDPQREVAAPLAMTFAMAVAAHAAVIPISNMAFLA